MSKLIRRACLTDYVKVASSVGLDFYRQFKAASLSRACLAGPDTMIDRPLAEVADLPGFSGLSAPSRWFNGRFDCSASAWRAAQRGRMVPAR